MNGSRNRVRSKKNLFIEFLWPNESIIFIGFATKVAKRNSKNLDKNLALIKFGHLVSISKSSF